HLEHLPLKHAPEPSLRERAGKWARRHPRVASLTTIGVLAGALIALLFSVVLIRGQRLKEMEAQETLARFLREKKPVQYLLTSRINDAQKIAQGVRQCRQVLGTYDVLENANWQRLPAVRNLSTEDQALLRGQVAELLVLLAQGLSLQALNNTDSA